jgi:hypothetical protein
VDDGPRVSHDEAVSRLRDVQNNRLNESNFTGRNTGNRPVAIQWGEGRNPDGTPQVRGRVPIYSVAEDGHPLDENGERIQLYPYPLGTIARRING